jgi:hypothetical protein
VSRYLVEFNSNDIALNMAGFDVCLAITALDLPLDIIVDVSAAALLLKLKSLSDYGISAVYTKKLLTTVEYEALLKNTNVHLFF